MTVKNDILSDNLENTTCHPVCRYLDNLIYIPIELIYMIFIFEVLKIELVRLVLQYRLRND